MFFRTSFICVLFQVVAELERFAGAAPKRPSLPFSAGQGDNLYSSLSQIPCLYFHLGESFYINHFAQIVPGSYWHASGEFACESMLWGSRVPFALHKNGIPELFCAGGESFSLGNCIFVCLLLALVAVQQAVKCLTDLPPLRKTWAALA